MSVVPISTGRSREGTDQKEFGQSPLPLGFAEQSQDEGDKERYVY